MDMYGRRMGCILFCVLEIVINTLEHFPNLYLLLFGRVLGGISTSLLFSAFDTPPDGVVPVAKNDFSDLVGHVLRLEFELTDVDSLELFALNQRLWKRRQRVALHKERLERRWPRDGWE